MKELGLECFRLYEQDIPECPFIIDIYRDHAVIYEKSDSDIDDSADLEAQLQEIFPFLTENLNIAPEHIHHKKRTRQKGLAQYEKMAREYLTLTV